MSAPKTFVRGSSKLASLNRAGFQGKWELLTQRVEAVPDAGLVSCLCVTRGRASRLRRALRCFQAQTYENRELVVVHEDIDDEARQLLARAPNVNLVHVPIAPKQPLGTLRNIAIGASRGTYVIGWDDDDWFAPRRVELQLRCLLASRAVASTLSRWLILDETNGRAYVSARRVWEGSLLCRRDLPILLEGYPPLARGEDLEFVDRLRARHTIAMLDRPELYVYTFHGKNTWGRDHFQGMFRMGSRLSNLDSKRVRGAVG